MEEKMAESDDSESGQKFFETFDRNFETIDNAIRNQANFAAALLLSAYTEIIGGFFRKTHARGNERENYNEGLRRMNGCYRKLVDENERGEDSMYTRIRCGLIHEYAIKKKSIIWLEADSPSGCGIEVVDENGDRVINFYPRQYFNDLKCLFKEFKNDIEQDAEIREYVNNIDLTGLHFSGVAGGF